MPEDTSFYQQNKERIMQEARGFYAGVRQILAASNGSEIADAVQRDSMARFQEIFAVLPDIGGAGNPLTGTLVQSAMVLGFYLASKSQGMPSREAGRISCEIIDAYYRTDEGRNTVKKATPESVAAQREVMLMSSGRLPWAEGWQTKHADASGFDMGWDNSECGILKLYEKFDAREYVPYQCMVDAIIYPLRGLGLVRSRTLVDSDCCDFRVKLGGETRLEPFARECLREWGKT